MPTNGRGTMRQNLKQVHEVDEDLEFAETLDRARAKLSDYRNVIADGKALASCPNTPRSTVSPP